MSASPMNRVEKIEAEVQRMTPAELEQFRAWFARFDADSWDRQFEADVKAGKLDALAARALSEHHAGRSTKL